MNTIIAYPRWLAEEQLSRSTWDTYLDQKEKPNTRWMKVVERNVTRSICLVPFPFPTGATLFAMYPMTDGSISMDFV